MSLNGKTRLINVPAEGKGEHKRPQETLRRLTLIWATVSWPVTSRVCSSWARTKSCMLATEKKKGVACKRINTLGQKGSGNGGWAGDDCAGEQLVSGSHVGKAGPARGVRWGSARPPDQPSSSFFPVPSNLAAKPQIRSPDLSKAKILPEARTPLPLPRRWSRERGRSEGAHVLSACCVPRHY